jgi:tetratricopeptide (TPR) repeat protein
MSKYLFIIILLSLSAISSLLAQNINSQTKLANQYYENKEFDKAETAYKELYEKTKADYYFNYYINSLAEQNKYKDAEREIKREMRRNHGSLNFHADLAYIYNEQGETAKADEVLQEAVNDLSSNKHQVFKLANALVRRKEYDYAIKVYEQAQKIFNRSFNREMANIYSVQRKYPEMINKYMDWLEENPKNRSAVESRLQFFVDRDHDNSFYKIMREELLKRIQKRNAAIANNQMLFWLYMQKKDFRQALIQAKAIDRRIFASGRDLKDLAEAAKNSKDYETALSAYQYLIEKGREHIFYMDAKLGRLDVFYRQIQEGEITDTETISEIESEYSNTIQQFGLGSNTIESVINLAKIQAFYLNKPNKADTLLQKAINVRGLSSHLAGRCKIARADILLLQNDLWEAVLIYAQAEKENRDHPTGDIAKLRKAMLAYYGNDFEWALAQFDALKKSTSKAVANDALKYSAFLKEYIKDDSLHTELSFFARADLLDFQQKEQAAIQTLDSLIDRYPTHPLKAHAYLKKAELSQELMRYEKAQTYYKKIISEFAQSYIAPQAMYHLAVLYHDFIKDEEEAAHYYKMLIMKHPESIFINQAAKRLRQIRDKVPSPS